MFLLITVHDVRRSMNYDPQINEGFADPTFCGTSNAG
jgi:hypothetical protein